MSTRPDISSSTRTDALDLAMMAHAEGYARGRADTLAAVRAWIRLNQYDADVPFGRFVNGDILLAALDTLAATPEAK